MLKRVLARRKIFALRFFITSRCGLPLTATLTLQFLDARNALSVYCAQGLRYMP